MRRENMNKHIAAALTQMGMSINSNLATGKYKGFEINAFYSAFDNVAPTKIHISCYTTDEQKRQINDALRAAATKYTKYSFTQYGLLIGMNDLTAKRLAGRLQALIDMAADILKNNGALGEEFCPVCGKPLNTSEHKAYTIDGIQITLDSDCLNSINKKIEAENADFYSAPNNYLKGFCGALIGAIVGAGVCFGLYMAGYIASLAAILSVILGWWLYKKFGGKQNWVMIVMIAVVTLAAMIASIYVAAIVVVGNAYAELGVPMPYLDAFKLEMSLNEELAGAFYSDLAMVALFTLLGIGCMIFTLIKSIKRPSVINK